MPLSSATLFVTTASGLIYPATVIARAMQAVWDKEVTTGPRYPATNVATNSAGTSSALPAGASYRTTSGQREVIVTGDGVDLSRWEFRIPLTNKGGVTSPNIFNDARFLGSEINLGPRYRNFYNGYDQNAGTLHGGARAVCNYCLFDYAAGPINSIGLSAQIQNGMWLDAGNTNYTSELTITNSKILNAQAAHLISYAATTLDDNYLGGFGMHPTDSNIHSEAVWIAAGVHFIRRNRMDASAAASVRLPNTWTGYTYANARYGPMSVTKTNNICHGGGSLGGVALQWGVHPTNPGTLGDIICHSNILEPRAGDVHHALTNMAGSDFDELRDNFDFISGARITTPAEVFV